MRLTLRDYQEETLARSAAAAARGVRRQLIVAATGLGKTVMFAAMAERGGGRTLVLAHRDELVSQAVDKIRQVWPEADVGVVKAERNEVRAEVVVASVQTLARPKRLAQLMAPWTSSTLLGKASPFERVVVDECHHATADTYRSILTALRCGEPERDATPDEVSSGYELGVMPEGPLLVGFTATPDRGDGKGLDDLFDEVVASWDILWGIRAGYLSDLRGVRVKLEQLDMGDVKVRRGDYDQGQAGRALEAAHAPEAIVRAWLADHDAAGGTVSARGRRTLVFTPTVDLAEHVAAEFVGAGVPAAWVSGETPLEQRRATLRAFSEGRVQVLANCAVLTEGYDEPAVSCVVVARPTKSRALYAQMVGRGTRLHPEKDHLLVLDVVGATAEHSLVTVPSLFGIDTKVREYREGESLTTAIGEQERELVRLGRMRAEEADLFAHVRRAGLAWVAVHKEGEPLRRYVLSIGSGTKQNPVPLVVLAQRQPAPDDAWTAGLHYLPPKGEKGPGEKRVLLADAPLETAQGVAEDWVRKHHPGAVVLTDTDAAWRKAKPSKKALEAARKWHLTVDPSWTAGELSDAMNAHIARIKSKPRRPKKAAAK